MYNKYRKYHKQSFEMNESTVIFSLIICMGKAPRN